MFHFQFTFVFFYTSVSERVFIRDAECRKLLNAYAATATSSELRRFSKTDMEHLIQMLQEYSPAVASLIESLNFVIPCPSTYGPLLKALSSHSPVCALIPPTLEADSLGTTSAVMTLLEVTQVYGGPYKTPFL